MQTVTGRRACDGPSCRSSQSSETQISTKGLWRSVLPFRHKVQRVDFQYPISHLKRDPATVRRAHDVPSWGPSLLPVFSRIEVCCSKRLNRSLHSTWQSVWLIKPVFKLNFVPNPFKNDLQNLDVNCALRSYMMDNGIQWRHTISSIIFFELSSI